MTVLKDIKSRYNLLSCSMDGKKELRDALSVYLNKKKRIEDKDVLNNIIMKCQLPTLTDLIDENLTTISELQTKNKALDQLIEEKSGSMSGDIEKYEKWLKHGKKMKMDEDIEEEDFN